MILVLGDSHSNVFNLSKKDFLVEFIGGATAQGSVNPNSKTNSLNIFTEKLKTLDLSKISNVIIMLGEVDCGFVIWYRHKKHNISINEQLNLSIKNLFDFVDNIILKYFQADKIIIAGSVLPCIKDNTDKKFLCGLRSEVDATIEERTKLTLKYNDILKETTLEKGFNYIDITKYIINEKTKLIDEYYLSDDPYDHHLNSKKTFIFWKHELEKKKFLQP